MKKNGYLSLCYHYVRSAESLKRFPRILGSTEDQFHKHIRMLEGQYQTISLDEAYKFSYKDFSLKSGRYGLLITFDDGLSDHYLAARILAECGIRGTFFVPTCVLKDKLPANPTIIHYCLAAYGIANFLDTYKKALEENELDVAGYGINFKKGNDPWATIASIKAIFKYRLSKDIARKVLLYIYKNLFQRDYPDSLEIMHLTTRQIYDIVGMGHSIGVHSHSHISVAASDLPEKDFTEEVIEPRRYLERTFDIPVYALSYPFGERQDCLSSSALIRKTKEYQLAFTIEKILNTKDTSPLGLGRYQPMSTDDDMKLEQILETIIDKSGNAV